LVSDDYSCKLSDFGTAKMVDHHLHYAIHTINAGTPLWMAPEVKMGNNYNVSADIYSLGLVFYELFEKQLPIWDPARQCVQIPPVYQSSSIVTPCINPNPQARPTADQIVDMLDKIIWNTVTAIKKFVAAEHYEVKGEFKTPDKEAEESKVLYKYLVGRPKEEIDGLLEKAFPTSKGGSSKHVSDSKHQIPSGQPIGQPPHYPPSGYPPGYNPNGQPPHYPPSGYPPGYKVPQNPPPKV